MKLKYKILIGIAGAFALYNMAWGAYYFTFYMSYCNDIGVKDETGNYAKSDETICYSVSELDYLSFTFNLAATEIRVYDSETGDERNMTICDIMVWPSLFGEDEYGVSLVKYEHDEVVIGSDYMVDQDLQILDSDEYSDELIAFFNENKETIVSHTAALKKTFPTLTKDKA